MSSASSFKQVPLSDSLHLLTLLTGVLQPAVLLLQGLGGMHSHLMLVPSVVCRINHVSDT